MKRSIENRLHGNGNIIAEAQRKGVSLSAPDRRIILRVRDQALAAGFCDSTIRALEWEGEQGMKGTMPFPVEARFIGVQEGGAFGLSFRMYNIEGDHVLNNSTVGVSTLVRERIPVLDLSFVGLWTELAKEQILFGWWFVLSAAERVRGFFHRGRP